MPASSSLPLIKGYIPVRLRLPRQPQLVRTRNEKEDNDNDNDNDSDDKDDNDNDNDMEDTFFFVREHQGRSSHENHNAETTNHTWTNNTITNNNKKGTTLFVANAPVVPGVSTKILLRSVFGRFADVVRVTAVKNPRGAAATASAFGEDQTAWGISNSNSNSNSNNNRSDGSNSIVAWTDREDLFAPTFLPPILSETEGKYAHVVFGSSKELKKAKKALEDLLLVGKMGSSSSSRSRSRSMHSDNSHNALVLDKLELQTLADESKRQHAELLKRAWNHTSIDDNDDDDDDGWEEGNGKDAERAHTTATAATGLLAVAQRYRSTLDRSKRSSHSHSNRSKLLEECNAVMQAYEDAEEDKRLASEAARSVPDEDGFVTVSYANNNTNTAAAAAALEQSLTATTPSRRKGNKRTRKKKEAVGAAQQTDFYRFQRADTRKRTMEDLRRKFEEDVRKVKRLKEEKEYRPF